MRLLIKYNDRLLAMLLVALLSPLELMAQSLTPGCLVFKAQPGREAGAYTGTLTNNCGKTVTGYTFGVTAVFSDGTSVSEEGMGQDLLGESFAPANSGLGLIQAGETRASRPWRIGTSGNNSKVISSVSANVTAVVFEDSSAAGDESGIGTIFRGRQFRLRELRFWQNEFVKNRDKLSAAVPLTKLIELADVPGREKLLKTPEQPTRVATEAKHVEVMLRALDVQVQNGQLTHGRAKEILGDRLAAELSLFDKHAYRRHP